MINRHLSKEELKYTTDADLEEIIASLFGTHQTLPSCVDYVTDTLVYSHMWLLVEAAKNRLPKEPLGLHDTMLRLARYAFRDFKGLTFVCLQEWQPEHVMHDGRGLAGLFG